jgi:hypothetical protein
MTAIKEMNPRWRRIDVISQDQTWLHRSMLTPRNTYGYFWALSPGKLVFGFG